VQATFNELRLSGCITERKNLRFTPAGLPVVDMVIEHSGTMQAAEGSRQISLRIAAKALGTLAERMQNVELGKEALFEGFLTPARQGKGLVFEIIRFELK